MEKLFLLFTRIKEITLWKRIFGWRSIRVLSYEAYGSFKEMQSKLAEQDHAIEEFKSTIQGLNSIRENLEKQIQESEKLIISQDHQIQSQDQKIENLNLKVTQLTETTLVYETTKEERFATYEKKINSLNQAKHDLETERAQLREERFQEKCAELEQLRKQWSNHESSVEQHIKMLCQKHLITYVDQVPFKGKPDNTVMICDEYIILDAKSPASNDLSNFPKYIKSQTESVSKYINQEAVYKELFLVVPSNTIESLSQLTYKMSEYTVYIVAKDSLEPILLALQKIEEYEFAKQLSPEERNTICRILGKFAHTTKRKIQIDQFFTNRFIDLLVKSKNELPDEILKSVHEFEKSEKLNPPIEKRTKQILTHELQEKNRNLDTMAQMSEINIPTSLDQLELLE